MFQESNDGAGGFARPLDMGQMTGVGDGLETRPRDRPGKGLAIGRRDDAVVGAPQHQRRYPHPMEPAAERRDSVLYLNPGSAGPKRFDLPVTVARLTLRDGEMEAKIVEVV